jgi:hypothetical protein
VVLSWREGKAEMRLLTIEKQVEICAHLVEGCGVRATARVASALVSLAAEGDAAGALLGGGLVSKRGAWGVGLWRP